MLVDQYGSPLAVTPPVRAKYDAAQHSADSAAHWAQADSFSAVSANSASVRKKLRERSRYEVANSSYLRGIVDSLANFSIGQGPSLNLSYRGDETEELRQAAAAVERSWADWSYARKLAPKLLTMHKALTTDGESFAVTTTGRVGWQTPVSLDVRLYEADHFDTVAMGGSWLADDAGLRIDANGEPTEYAFTSTHPGDQLGVTFENEWLSADQVLHLFRADRPGQLRGIPATTPSLPLAALLRRYTLATVAAAEVASSISAVLKSNTITEDPTSYDPWDSIAIVRGMMLTLPEGMDISQFRPEQPTATYEEFCKALMREIARCLNIPVMLALGSAENSNYSSARLDLQSFIRGIEVERAAIFERACLDRLFEMWLDEALLIDGFLPPLFTSNAASFSWQFRWTQMGHVDRAKEANGQLTELGNLTTNLAREYGQRGLDWRVELEQRAREVQYASQLGLTMAAPLPVPPAPEVLDQNGNPIEQ